MTYILEMTGFNPLAHGTETHYKEYDTEEEAVAFFKQVVTKYPNIFTFKLYEAKLVGLPYDIQEGVSAAKSAEYIKMEEMKSLLRRAKKRGAGRDGSRCEA